MTAQSRDSATASFPSSPSSTTRRPTPARGIVTTSSTASFRRWKSSKETRRSTMSESEVVGRENGRRAVTWALVAGAFLVLAVPVAVKAGATRAYVAPSSSMAPTIQIGDRFLVELKHGGQSPHRGELWVMRDPALIGRSATYVKRIVGLPGETIEIRGAV